MYLSMPSITLTAVILALALPSSYAQCRSGSFRCQNGNGCIPSSYLCDQDNDCGDYSDEANCGFGQFSSSSCSSSQLSCSNGNCVPSSWRCDGDNDCGDMSDESNCGPSCSSSQFTCSNGNCVSSSWLCDGDNDCGDMSDESNCGSSRSSCSSSEISCSNGNCVPSSWRCDGDNDCGDMTDESNCGSPPPSCSSSQFTCSNGNCVPSTWLCDGDNDCRDMSDERNCAPPTTRPPPPPESCPRDRRACPRNPNVCIYPSWICDGEADCPDGSDEENCNAPPPPGPPAPPPAPSPPASRTRCGLSAMSRIMGGTVAAPGEFPWLVKLRPKFGSSQPGNCGGMLVSPEWVLTAAHCIAMQSQLADEVTLLFGRHDLTSTQEDGQERKATKIIKNPKFSDAYTDQTQFNYDFALLKVDTVEYTRKISPICLPESCDQIQSKCSTFKVAGWGLTDENRLSEVLQYASEDRVDNTKCNNLFTDFLGKKISLTDSQICAGNGYPTSCHGDSGGPLMCTFNGRAYAAGVVSWGIPGCLMDDGASSIYGNVCEVLPWINESMDNN